MELRDGTRVVIRPIEPDDRVGLADGFERLSPESRYRRFFAAVAQLSERDLDHLTQVDHHDHEALVAIVEGTGEGIGVARYVRTGPDVAEPAMVVLDDWQGRGAGSRLLDALVERAREEGIRRFEAPVLAYNADAIHLLASLGETTRKRQDREVQLTVELPEAEPGARVRPLLRQFAIGALEPGRALLERLWPQRRAAPGEPARNLIVVGTDGSEHAVAAVEAADEKLRAGGLSVQAEVRRGDPALVLADVAAEENARLIVVGAGERGKLARRLIGSVADLVAERAPCSVLIVRPGALER